MSEISVDIRCTAALGRCHCSPFQSSIMHENNSEKSFKKSLKYVWTSEVLGDFGTKAFLQPAGKWLREDPFKTVYHGTRHLKPPQLRQGARTARQRCVTAEACGDRLFSSYDSTPNAHTHILRAAANISQEIRRTWIQGDSWQVQVMKLQSLRLQMRKIFSQRSFYMNTRLILIGRGWTGCYWEIYSHSYTRLIRDAIWSKNTLMQHARGVLSWDSAGLARRANKKHPSNALLKEKMTNIYIYIYTAMEQIKSPSFEEKKTYQTN